MQKSATLNLRVDPAVKQSAESVLSQLGSSMSTAVDMFLRQVSLTGGIPFRVALPGSLALTSREPQNAKILTSKFRKIQRAYF